MQFSVQLYFIQRRGRHNNTQTIFHNKYMHMQDNFFFQKQTHFK